MVCFGFEPMAAKWLGIDKTTELGWPPNQIIFF